MFGIPEKVRSFFQPIIRGYEAIKAGVAHTFEILRGYEPTISESEIREDYLAYQAGTAIQRLDEPLVKEYLIPWYVHGKAPVNLSANFKYDVQVTFENLEGETEDVPWSIISDERLSPEEVMRLAESFPADYEVEGFPFHGAMELVGVWRKD